MQMMNLHHYGTAVNFRKINQKMLIAVKFTNIIHEKKHAQ